MTDASSTLLTAITRFGLSPGAGELTRWGREPRTQVAQSLIPSVALPEGDTPAVNREAAFGLLMRRLEVIAERRGQMSAGQADGAPRMADAGPAFTPGAEVLQRALASRTVHAVRTPSALSERLVIYWTDHFTVSASVGQVAFFADAFEREAIRPHALGRFADMAKAAILHPAMLYYLDNRSSAGPKSETGLATRGRRGLNENLAREALELHTLGADGGYAQQDVVEMAKVLTGWSVETRAVRSIAPGMGFFPQHHEPGTKTILGKTYPEAGANEALAVIDDLARHPATARHVTRRMVHHFVGHGLPGLEARMAEVFRRTDGDLGTVTRALVQDDEAWGPPRKVRPPIEILLSTARLLGGLPARPDPMRALQAMGQPFWAAPSPKGWPDGNDDWAAPDAIKTRLDWASELAANLPPGTDARALLDTAFGPAASAETRRAVERAADGRQAITLLLLSPEFQRR